MVATASRRAILLLILLLIPTLAFSEKVVTKPPHRPPILEMDGTPKELAIQLAEQNMDVTVRGRAPLETVEIP